MELGIKSEIEFLTTEKISAKTLGSGDIDVLATPAIIVFCEKAAKECVRGWLEDGETTVGTSISLNHISPTPIGMKVRCIATLIDQDRRNLKFKVEAYDEVSLIATGEHSRFIVNTDKFMDKANSKGAVKTDK